MGDEVALGSQIFVVDGQIVARGDTPGEVKVAIKELRLLKKDELAKRREIQAEMKLVKAERRAVVANRLPLVRGGGTFGRILRGGVQGKRAAERGQHDDRVAAIERRIMAVDRNVGGIDQTIAQCEAALLRMGPSTEPRASRAAAPGASSDPLASLNALATMREQGLVTDDEYNAKKVELLERM